MKRDPEKSDFRPRGMNKDPLDPEYLPFCSDSSPDLLHVLHLAGSVSSPALGSGLRSSLRTSAPGLARTPHTPTRLLGVHNPTGLLAEFAAGHCFPDVSAGKAFLVFLGGSVETSGQSRSDLRFLLQPGAHVWLAQTDSPVLSPAESAPERAVTR